MRWSQTSVIISAPQPYTETIPCPLDDDDAQSALGELFVSVCLCCGDHQSLHRSFTPEKCLENVVELSLRVLSLDN